MRAWRIGWAFERHSMVSRRRDREVGRVVVAAALDELRRPLAEQPQDKLRPPDALAAELHSDVLQMQTGWVDVGLVAGGRA